MRVVQIFVHVARFNKHYVMFDNDFKTILAKYEHAFLHIVKKKLKN